MKLESKYERKKKISRKGWERNERHINGRKIEWREMTSKAGTREGSGKKMNKRKYMRLS